MAHADEGTAETERLRALRDLQLLDTPPERDFDDMVQLASKICGCPISLISLVDADRQWFKATVGTDIRETSRDLAFCSQAIEQAKLFIVEDASRDPRFQDNPLVTGNPGIRFYAGIPLYDAGQYAMGTLCVLDTAPRTMTDSQKEMLTILGRQTKLLLQLRIEKRRLEVTLHEREALAAALCREKEVLFTERHMFESFLDQSPNPCFLKTVEGRYRFYNASMAKLFGIDRSAWIGRRDEDVSPAEIAEQYRTNDIKVLESGRTSEMLERVNDATGRARVYRSRKFVIHNAGSKLLGGVAVDITEELERQKELEQANCSWRCWRPRMR